MPNFDNIHDIFNDTKNNFNPNRVHAINDYHISLYGPHPYCRICEQIFEKSPPPCNDLEGCKKRIRMKRLVGPHEESDYFVKHTLMIRSNPGSLVIRTGQMYWLYDNHVKCIIRGTRNNGFSLHHKDGNAYNDTKGNPVMLSIHEKKHGTDRSLAHGAILCESIFERTGDIAAKKVLTIIEHARSLHQIMMEDSPLVWRTILINHQLIRGEITQGQCYDLLVELGVAKGIRNL